MFILSEIQIKCNIWFSDIVLLFMGDIMRYEILKFENIRKLRLDNGYTQKQIAEMLGVSQNTYSQYEIGVLNYPVDVIIKLAAFYGTTTDYLLGRTDIR